MLHISLVGMIVGLVENEFFKGQSLDYVYMVYLWKDLCRTVGYWLQCKRYW